MDNAIRVFFSERMDPSTITGSTITVSNGGTQVIGTVAFDGVSIATFTHPTDNLAAGTLYTVTVTTGVQDYWGNAMVSTFTSTFTTAGGSSGSSPGRSSGGCSVPACRNGTIEDGLTAILALLSPLVFIGARRIGVRWGGL